MGPVMQFNKPLAKGILRKRYKRFLTDIETETGHELTIHCPNTGAMTGCAEPGFQVWYSDSENDKRKYRHTWELAQNFSKAFICVNTQRANQVAGEYLKAGKLTALQNIEALQAERKYGAQNSRIDWYGVCAGVPCYIEVKSVTLAGAEQQGYFPDARSTRAHKHLQELIEMRQQGARAIVLYVVMHTGIKRVHAAAEIDPEYADLCKQAEAAGVEFYAIGCNIDSSQITAAFELPVSL